MTINNFKTIAEIINHTLFFNFINKKDNDFTYSYIFTELQEFYCGQNPLALAEPEKLIPFGRAKLINHLQSSEKSGLKITQRRINLKHNLRHKIKLILKKPYSCIPVTTDESKGLESKNLKLIRKAFARRQDKINMLQATAINQNDDFSVFNDLISNSFMSIDSLGPRTLVYLENYRLRLGVIRRKDDPHTVMNKMVWRELVNELVQVRNKFQEIIAENGKIYDAESDQEQAIKKREGAWDSFLNKDIQNESPLFIDLKIILQNLNNISQRDSKIHMHIKMCKYNEAKINDKDNNNKCERPYFYSYDTGQTTCGSTKCQKRNRKSK